MLEKLGHYSETCKTADEAMNILTRRQFDVVLTDILIDGPINGLKLRTNILEKYPDIRVLCTSGYSDPREQNETLDPDIEFLPKPICLEDLYQILA